jgi:hypothetical protein
MDNKLIITITFTILATGVIAPFTKSIFDKIFVAYNPDPKKISSGIKKSLVFIFAYILPVADLIYLYISNYQVDKFFVLQSSLLLFVIFLNLTIGIIFYILKKVVFPHIYSTLDNQKDAFQSIDTLLAHQKFITSLFIKQAKDEDLTKEILNNTDINKE